MCVRSLYYNLDKRSIQPLDSVEIDMRNLLQFCHTIFIVIIKFFV